MNTDTVTEFNLAEGDGFKFSVVDDYEDFIGRGLTLIYDGFVQVIDTDAGALFS